jgi:hypothetical protein
MITHQARKFISILVDSVSLGYKVLVVEGEIYVLLDWQKGLDLRTDSHTMIGRDITYLVEQYPNISGGGTHIHNELREKINGCLKVRREFSTNQNWTIYSRG